jgi:hypothetical protein
VNVRAQWPSEDIATKDHEIGKPAKAREAQKMLREWRAKKILFA